ncbi:ATP-binding protein [Nonomuraea zeae]|uniref:ATP-binding protein n=1 Tax=Nonomuraea zeae TaxID=1642303 RepID=A0A5S4F930_9ACTN|nr:ATP-binding protein [Nonomuraea zeae]TMR13120.1 ATP-binding protein [Nonomuraea zeae]
MSEPSLQCPITPDLALLRSQLHTFAIHAGLADDRAADLIIAINEAAANVLDHGAGTGVVTARHDSDGIWVEVVDPGGTLTADHLFLPAPSANALRGMGLRIIRRLCDEVIVDHPDGHSRLRIHLSRRPDEPTGTA